MTSSGFGRELDNLLKKISFTKDDVQDLGDEILKTLAERLHELIVLNSPKASGDYSKGWKVNDVEGNEVTVTNPDEKKFTILEFTGRPSGRINAPPGKMLHFVINGEDIFVTFIDHPGFQPEPHVRPALEQLEREAKDIMLKMIKKKFPIFT